MDGGAYVNRSDTAKPSMDVFRYPLFWTCNLKSSCIKCHLLILIEFLPDQLPVPGNWGVSNLHTHRLKTVISAAVCEGNKPVLQRDEQAKFPTASWGLLVDKWSHHLGVILECLG